MKEAFLHFVWRYKKFQLTPLTTTQNQAVHVHTLGQYNTNSGPDFFNAKIEIDQQLWAGNVEIHVKSSDWYAHKHETDTNYDNVILHVVWDDDVEVFRKDGTVIPALELKHYVDAAVIERYNNLLKANTTWINCEQDIAEVDKFSLTNWLERLYIERLEQKSELILKLLKNSQNDWEAVLFKLLAKSFGLKVNADAFLSVANSFDFSLVRKLQSNSLQLEALFFGQAKLLEHSLDDKYYKTLQQEYKYLKQKFKLSQTVVVAPQFFRLRPTNFPTIRLAQLANLYYQHKQLFSKVIHCTSAKALYNIFSVSTSVFWKSHYTFSKSSKTSEKKLTKGFIDLLLINTLIPLQFSYAKYTGTDNNATLITFIQDLKAEQNTVIKRYKRLGVPTENALHSQALLQLKTKYCDVNKCLQCAIGNVLLNR